MKRIDAVIRQEQFDHVKRSLDSIHCPGMMVFTFCGHGKQGGSTETYKGRKVRIDLLPKVLITVFSNDNDADLITDVIVKSARTGKIGDGKIFVASVDNAIRIRTGEKGPLAL